MRIWTTNVLMNKPVCISVSGNHSIAVFEEDDDNMISPTPSAVVAVNIGSDGQITTTSPSEFSVCALCMS